MKPKRIQRKRTKGWRMPPNTVYVGRGSKWGNPYKIGDTFAGTITTPELAKGYYKEFVVHQSKLPDISELEGKNLACWCPIDKPCHADILLQIANEKAASK